MNLRATVRDVWCAVTKKCQVKPIDDEYLQWLRNQERSSRDAVAHHQRINVLEEALLHERLKQHGKVKGPQ